MLRRLSNIFALKPKNANVDHRLHSVEPGCSGQKCMKIPRDPTTNCEVPSNWTLAVNKIQYSVWH